MSDSRPIPSPPPPWNESDTIRETTSSSVAHCCLVFLEMGLVGGSASVVSSK